MAKPVSLEEQSLELAPKLMDGSDCGLREKGSGDPCILLRGHEDLPAGEVGANALHFTGLRSWPAKKQKAVNAGGAAVANSPAVRLPAATAAPIGPVVTLVIPIADLAEDPENVRKEYDLAALDQLGESMKLHGQLEPIGVRPAKAGGQAIPGKYFVKWGHRRLWAAIQKKMPSLRAEVLDATDDQVPALQLAENDQREALKALERSNAHQQMKARGLTTKQIADATTTSEATVRDSLKLQELVPSVKKAWAEGQLDYSKALEVAKLPGKLQPAFLKDILEGTEDGEPLSVRQIRNHGMQYFMLDLAKAPFAIADAQLVPKAGACTNCLKRTGAQPEFFEGVKADLCTDKPCHSEKLAAHLAQAEKSGRRVLNEGTAKQIFNEYAGNDRPQYGSTYVLADEKPHGAKKSYRQQVDPKDIALVRNPATGSVLEVISKTALPKEKREEVAPRKKDPAQVKQERDHGVRVEASKAARLALLEVVKKSGTDTHWLRVAIAGMVSSARSEPLKDLCRWRGIEADSGERAEAINELASKLAGGELRALLFDVAMAERITPHFNGGEHTKLLRTACTDMGVDLGQLGKEARAALDADLKAKADKKAGKKPMKGTDGLPITKAGRRRSA